MQVFVETEYRIKSGLSQVTARKFGITSFVFKSHKTVQSGAAFSSPVKEDFIDLVMVVPAFTKLIFLFLFGDTAYDDKNSFKNVSITAKIES